jgi:hypothetical protein
MRIVGIRRQSIRNRVDIEYAVVVRTKPKLKLIQNAVVGKVGEVVATVEGNARL